MSDISAPPVPFGIRAVLAMAMETLGSSWLKLLGLTLPAWILHILAFGGVVVAVQFLPGLVDSWLQICAVAFALIFEVTLSSSVCQAPITRGVAELLRGRSLRFRQSMSAGLSRFGLMFGVSVLIVAICGGFTVASALLAAYLPEFAAKLAIVALCGIGGSMVASAFFVVLPVAAMEKHDAPGCFKRSRLLTRGYRWPIFGLFLILAIGYSALCVLASLLGDAVLPPLAALIIPILFQICLAALVSVVIAVAYFRLLLLKEGGGLDQITAVFE